MKKVILFCLAGMAVTMCSLRGMLQMQAEHKFQLLLPWIGKIEKITEALEGAKDNKLQTLTMNECGCKAFFDFVEDTVTLTNKHATVTVAHYYFINSIVIQESMPPIQNETKQRVPSESQWSCIIS
jgi:hypothetical protein